MINNTSNVISAGLLPVLTILQLLSGCATIDYQFGIGEKTVRTQPFDITHAGPAVSCGNSIKTDGEHPTVDRIESIVQAPRQFVCNLLHRPELNETEIEAARQQAVELSQTYLAANGLTDVHLDVRRYEPAEQWERLKANQQIAPIWKYTGGTLNHINYTLFPMRAFHADLYDPFTNTLSLNSAQPVAAVYHAADAKQFRRQKYPGPYAMAQHLPLVPLFHRAAVGSEAIGYAKEIDDPELEQQLYPVAYSKLGAAAVTQAVTLGTVSDTSFPNVPLLTMVGGGVGRMTGRLVASQKNELEPEHRDQESGNEIDDE